MAGLWCGTEIFCEKIKRSRLSELADDVLVGEHARKSQCLVEGDGLVPLDAHQILGELDVVCVVEETWIG